MSVQPATTEGSRRVSRSVKGSASLTDVDYVKKSLTDRILSRLGFTQHDYSGRGTVKEVVKTYGRSIERLGSVRDEAAQFIEALCKTHFYIHERDAQRVDRLQQAATEELGNLLNDVRLSSISVSPNLEAELFTLDAFDAYSLLRDHLHRSVEGFVENFFAVLDRLVEHQVVGEIEWPLETGCRFRCFETHLRERDVNTTRSDMTITTTGKIDVEIHGQRQHLIETTRYSLPKYPRLIPQRFHNLLEECPTWLRPEVEVVEGDLFRSDTGKHLVKTKRWLEERVLQRQLPRLERPMVGYHNDPAITLGPYVFAAWLCEEREKELHEIQQTNQQRRQRLSNQREAAKNRAYGHLAVAGCLQLIPLLLHLAGSSLWAPLHILALILSFVSLVPVWWALQEYALAHDAPQEGPSLVLGTVAACFASLAWQCGFLALTRAAFPPVIGLLVFAAAAFFFVRESLAAVRACRARI